MPKTILVTGATGFIAKHIVLQLLQAGHTVRGSSRSLDRAEELRQAVAPHLDDATALDRLNLVALDLNSDDGWAEAMKGVDALIHTASPFPLTQPDNDEELIRPAVDGALRALRAAHAAGIRRVILTSSVVAVENTALPDGKAELNEGDWSDLEGPTATAYGKSKTLAERAAWDFVKAEAPEIALTVINPGFVLGPPLDDYYGTSIQVIERVLKAKDPMVPQMGFETVDVRDIALMHVRALERPKSAGLRIIGSAGHLSFPEMADALAAAYPDRKIVTRRAPNWMVRLLAVFDKSLRSIVPILGRKVPVSNARARDVLGMEFRAPRDAALASADYVVKQGKV